MLGLWKEDRISSSLRIMFFLFKYSASFCLLCYEGSILWVGKRRDGVQCIPKNPVSNFFWGTLYFCLNFSGTNGFAQSLCGFVDASILGCSQPTSPTPLPLLPSGGSRKVSFRKMRPNQKGNKRKHRKRCYC